MKHRTGSSLLELILAMGILSILVGLLLGAIQKIRIAAMRAELANQTRQIGLSVLHIESTRGKIPKQFDKSEQTGLTLAILKNIGYSGADISTDRPVQLYISRLDPSYSYYPDTPHSSKGQSSFGFNFFVFENLWSINSIKDGTSSTLMLSERYARCGEHARVLWGLGISVTMDQQGNIIPATNYTDRTATFCDHYYDDILPVYDPVTRMSRPSVPGLTFQLAPRPDACDPRVLQASTRSGLVVGMMDGSVRTIAPGIDPAIYWSVMTPDKGEVASLE